MEEGLIHLNQSLTANLEEVGESFWEHRPFWAGGDLNLYPTSIEEAAADLWWHIGTASVLHGASIALGGEGSYGPLRAANLVMGEALGLYRPGQVVHSVSAPVYGSAAARGTHVTGSTMSLTEAAWFHRWRMARGVGSVARFFSPLATAALVLELVYLIPPSGKNAYKPKQLGPTEFVPQNSFEW